MLWPRRPLLRHHVGERRPTPRVGSIQSMKVVVYSHDADIRARVRLAIGRRPATDVPEAEIIEVATQPALFRLLDAGGADVMVLDGEAQPAGGMGVCRQAKDEIHACPPVLLIIGRPDDGWLATWSGADEVISHPIDPRALASALAGPLVDLVGTGGDAAHTVNISTMGAIVAAAAGARVAKHGNRAASSACGAADVLEALGVVITLPPECSAQLAEEVGIAFLFAPLYHPAYRHSAAPRRELGVPTVFNFLGPVANPARPGAQAVGVSDPRMGAVLAGVLAARGCSALVFHGDDGLDELTTADTSTVWVVHAGEVSQTVLDPAALGLPMSKPGDLRGGDAAHNATVARSVLDGEPGPIRDTVVLNAAAALAAAEGVPGAGGLEQTLAGRC